MLSLRIKAIFKARGIRYPYAWLAANGVSEPAARKLAAEAYRNLPLNNLEQLCLLLRCTPNDVLRWEPAPGTDTAHQPLAALLATEDNGLEWLNDIGNMSIDELRALGEKVKAAQADGEAGG